jgi:hypothetical protein
MECNLEQEFSLIKKNKIFDDEQLLQKYLSFLFYDLMSRDEKSELNGLYKVYFHDFLRLPLVVAENLMRIFTGGQKSYIKKDQFIAGLYSYLTADFYSLTKFFYKICDFDNDGVIQVADLMLMLNYLFLDNYPPQVKQFQISMKNSFTSYNKLSIPQFTTLLINKNIIFDVLQILLNGVPITKDSIDVLKIEELKKLHIREKIDLSFDTSQNNEKIDNLDKTFNHKSSDELNKSNLKFDGSFNLGKEDVFAEENMTDETYRYAQNLPVFRSKESLTHLNQFGCSAKNIIPKRFEEIKINIIPDNDYSTTGKKSNYESGKLSYIHSTCTSLPIVKKPPLIKIIKVNTRNLESVLFWSNSEDVENKISEHHYKTPKEVGNNQIINLKFNSTHDGFIYKLTKNNKKIRKYWVALINYDFYYFNSKQSKFKGLHNLSKCFSEMGEKIIIDNITLYSFSLHTYQIKRTYYCDSLEECKKWIETIKLINNYRNVREFYEISKFLGKGNFGEVRLGIDKKTNKQVAIKIVEKSKRDLKEINAVRREAEILIKCKHPNIIKYIDLFESKDRIYLILEYYAGGNLKSYLVNQDDLLSDHQVKKIFLQICKGLQHLSNLFVIHRDIKPENIMLTKSEDPQFKIIDFGLSVVVGPGNKIIQNCGTKAYSAPEVIHEVAYNREVDVWSLGILLYYIISGTLPFGNNEISLSVLENKNFDDISRNINMTGFAWACQSPMAIDLIRRCLTKPSDRISLEQIFEHPWLKKIQKSPKI